MNGYAKQRQKALLIVAKPFQVDASWRKPEGSPIITTTYYGLIITT
jgi:hypothetical protein